MTINQNKFYGLDYLRAVCIIFVLIWHVGYYTHFNLSKFLGPIANVLAYNFCSLAVPIFFQMSFFLFYISRGKKEKYFIHYRLPKLSKIYGFWLVFNFVYFAVKYQGFDVSIFRSFKSILFFIVSGGPSVFYFIASLIILTTLAEIVASILKECNSKKLYYSLLFAISCLVLFLLPIIRIYFNGKFSNLTIFWNPLNFLPYVFSSFIIFDDVTKSNFQSKAQRSRKRYLLVAVFLIFCIFDWQFTNHFKFWYESSVDQIPLPTYSRLSLVFGAMLITQESLRYFSKPPAIIELISNYSLGIYCVHIFLLLPLVFFVQSLWFVPAKVIVIFFLLISLSIFLTFIMKKTKLLQEIV